MSRKQPPGARRRQPNAERETAVSTQKSPIDVRPFRSKAEREREQSLESQYRSVAIPELAAVLRQPKGNEAGQAT